MTTTVRMIRPVLVGLAAAVFLAVAPTGATAAPVHTDGTQILCSACGGGGGTGGGGVRPCTRGICRG